MMYRLFVALRPPRALRARLLGVTDGVNGARWQDDEQFHLTLRFIGEVDRPTAEDVAAGLDRVRGLRPTISIEGVGTFDRKGRAHTLWAGVAPDPALGALRRRVERALILAGVAPDPRAFHPHITLARLGGEAGPVQPFLERHAGLVVAAMTCDAFMLFESRLGHAGASYSAIARYPLG